MRPILICSALEDVPKSHVPAQIGRCDICGCAVWVSRSSPRGAIPRCQQCVKLTMEPDARVEPLTRRQSDEVTKWRKTHLS